MKKKLLSALTLILLPVCLPAAQPNILMIAVDDLNDWIGVMGGHPQVKTPNIDRLAQRGVLFTNAHCQSPVCNPSRASMLSGLYPETTGIYFLSPPPEASPVIMGQRFMPQRFLEDGYHVTGVGKIFHNGENQNESYIPNYGGQFGGFGPYPKKKLSSFGGHPLWDWGIFPEKDEQMPDHQIADWAIKQMGKAYDRPLWMGVGFYRPHVPQYAPQHWFDLYPLDTLRLPETIEGDLKDVPDYAVNLTQLEQVAPAMQWVLENSEWKPLVRSYLACVSFVDHQIGRVLDALDQRSDSDRTYIVLYSDHGFHLGEKERFEKRSLWQDGAGVPLIIVGPGIAKGQVCDKPVQLLDIYPTLLDLSGLEADPSHEGNSLRPLLENPNAEWKHVARTSFGPGNVAIVSEQYRYISYSDGSEELYDRRADRHEWQNLARDPRLTAVMTEHRAHLPKDSHPVLGKDSTGHKAFAAAEAARATKPSPLRMPEKSDNTD